MRTIEFLEDVHTYVCDGVVIPSVSELIRFKFPDQYKGIPDEILKRKANYGSKVHKYIEDFATGQITMEEIQQKKINPDIKIAVEQFEMLRKKWMFIVKDVEQIVCWRGKYAGTYDIRTIDDYIADLKTTNEIHDEWLRWQLGLYYMASGIEKDFGYVIWLPKGKMAQVKQIAVASHSECKQLVKEYEKAHPSR
ncbi:MAG: hypothetical protein IKE23_05160 [Exiguobacterium sp.]|nr:hypothetical protein [Exiguobacterium sp.]